MDQLDNENSQTGGIFKVGSVEQRPAAFFASLTIIHRAALTDQCNATCEKVHWAVFTV